MCDSVSVCGVWQCECVWYVCDGVSAHVCVVTECMSVCVLCPR